MDIEHFRQKLLQKRDELKDEIARQTENSRERVADVQDPIDLVTSSESQAGSLQISSVAYNTLAQVESALQRIADGTYGTSIESGEPIPEARLEAVPWAAYTVGEQERLDELKSQEGASTQLETAS